MKKVESNFAETEKSLTEERRFAELRIWQRPMILRSLSKEQLEEEMQNYDLQLRGATPTATLSIRG